MGSFDGITAVVTGSSGIAAAVARRLVTEGAAVGVVGVDEDELRGLEDRLAPLGQIVCATADLRDQQATTRAFDGLAGTLGSIDAVAAVAGGSGRGHGDGPLHEVTADAWRATWEQNATPVYTTAHEAVRRMRGRGGSLVIVSSVLAVQPSSPRFETHAYAAAKGAALSLTRAMAAAYAPERIRVNAVMPAVTDTPMASRAAEDPELQAYVAAKQPLARGMVDAADVAAAITFLLGPDSAAITGQWVAVDGGWSVSEPPG